MKLNKNAYKIHFNRFLNEIIKPSLVKTSMQIINTLYLYFLVIYYRHCRIMNTLITQLCLAFIAGLQSGGEGSVPFPLF